MPGEVRSREHVQAVLNEQGYVSVEFGISGSDMDELFVAFRGVLDEVYSSPSQHGQDVIDAFAVETPGRPFDSRGFLEQRRAGQVNRYEIDRAPTKDNKDVLHFTPISSFHVLEHMQHRGGMSRDLRNLHSMCVDLQQAAASAVKPALDALGASEELISPYYYDNVHVLRVIRYLNPAQVDDLFKAQDELAELHFDRGKFTAALWESSSGLVGAPAYNQRNRPNQTVEEFNASIERALASPISHHSGWLKLFAGAGLNHLPDTAAAVGDIPLLLHGVTDDNPFAERDAVVLFMNEHTGIHNGNAPPAYECKAGEVQQQLAARQIRYGGLVEPGV